MVEKKKNGSNNNNSKSRKNRKTIITIEEEIIGPYSVNYVKRKEIVNNNNNKAKEVEVIEEEDAKALESIRRKAIADLQSEETTAQQKIDAGWRLLQSFGFEGNKPQKPWKWFEREGGYYY